MAPISGWSERMVRFSTLVVVAKRGRLSPVDRNKS
jgi:hypothetical protein